ncbi:MAG TPA: hypothetical protein VGO20_21540 [Arenibaculum sp.]|nr:hypothetical protein [Arenibaculum sp.]
MQPSVSRLVAFPTGFVLAEALLRLTVPPARALAAARRLAPYGMSHPEPWAVAGLSIEEAEPLRALPLLLRRAGDGRNRLTLLCVDPAGRLLREEMLSLRIDEPPTRLADHLACSAAFAGSAATLAIRTFADAEVPVPGDGDLYLALADAMAARGLDLVGYLAVAPGGHVRLRR